jgi:predicted regulator of Ras-like GTPase activity (Roadblock/LC7/MglB family)
MVLAFECVPVLAEREAQLGPADATENSTRDALDRRPLWRRRKSLDFAELADRLRREGDLSGAAAICTRGLMHHPAYATGHVVMGEIFRDTGLVERAEEEWRDALRLDPHHPRAHLHLGGLYVDRGEMDRAVIELEATLLSDPASEEARALLDRARGETAAQHPGHESESTAEQGWRPDQRPPWLTPERFEELVEATVSLTPVRSVVLCDPDALVLAERITSCDDRESAGAIGLELLEQARGLASYLGAGRLASAMIKGTQGGLQCLALGDIALVCLLGTRARPVTVDEIGNILLNLQECGPADELQHA